MIGRTLAHYKILDKLGEGGMGEVYLAEDTELRRQVALKVLRSDTAQDAEHLERFRREARAVAALNHPNIVTIHSVEAAALDDEAEGERLHFLTMELVDGVGLDHKIPSDGLASDKIFELAIPLADALSTAHKSGITHRDLKPANVMLTADGRVKILDFGLAKLAADDSVEQDTTVAVTQPGMVMGTIPYMSPEQVAGESVDHRTDIFALGVVLYEMATGRRPFAAENSSHLISSILRDDPPAVTEIRQELPFHLGRIIRRCLEKDPDRRYQSALDVRNELEALRDEVHSGAVTAVSEVLPAPATAPPRSRWQIGAALAGALLLGIAAWVGLRDRSGPPAAAPGTDQPSSVVVLPFENLGPPEDEYFAAGITEEITGRLATMGHVRVISRNSAIRYANTDKTLRQIGDELSVDHVLEGSIRWAKAEDGSRVRITPRLTRVSDDSQIWSATYDKVFADVFEVQSDIADRVTESLGATLLDRPGADGSELPTQNPDAYQAYLRALDRLRGSTLTDYQLGLDMLDRAVELDPAFAQAWGRIAWVSSQRYFNGDFRDDWLAKAEHAIDRATALAPEDPLVRLAEGFYHYYGHRRFDRALEIFERVVEEQPNNADALSAVGYIYRRQGKFEQAIDQLEAASTLDPQNADLLTAIAETYGASRDFAAGLEAIDRGLALAPENAQLYIRKATLQTFLTGETADARETLSSAPEAEWLHQSWVQLDWLDRDFEAALARIEGYQPANAFDELNIPITIALTYQLMGEEARARPMFEGSLVQLQRMLEASPDEPGLLLSTAMLHALLGHRERALSAADRAVELTANDRYAGPSAVEGRAMVYATLGDTDAAIDIVEELLGLSYSDPLTRQLLAKVPFWDPLRSHPRFAGLVAGD